MAYFNIRDIFQNTYSIPIYQRAYAWTEKEINTLIDDVYDYYQRENNQNYYIGSLVIHSDTDDVTSVIDGQQRLTTLSLLICYLKNESQYSDLASNLDVSLNFESRKRSTDIFRTLKNKDSFEKILDLDNELVDGYRVIRKKFLEKDSSTHSDKFDEGYFKYLLENVILIKNELPKDTDLNHYFEIMNNRGEQLEKHEIVKAYLLGLLPDEDSRGRSVISEVWNACQRLDKYVQIGFKPEVREQLFSSNWNQFIPTNFILQVLKLLKDKDTFDWNYESRGISLDDKRLVDQFEEQITSVQDVYEFMYLLLKTRFVFDNYVIKTDSINDNSSDDSNWSLHKPYMLIGKNRNNKKLSPRNTFYDDDVTQNIVVKIESMFQVTDPRQSYKSFLLGLVKILNDYAVLSDNDLLVKKLIAFASQRFTSLTKNDSVFDSGVDTPNYIFNFLDFVLWYQETHGANRGIKATDFEFKYRNSVEHFYPQNPNADEGHEKLPPEELNNFGNLCIMARGHNSLRSNLMPDAKIKEFKATDQSLKFELMQKLAENDGIWYIDQINKHSQQMKDILSEFVEKDDK